MDRIKILEVNLKQIVIFDMSFCQAEEFKMIIEKFCDFIKKQGKNSVRLLVDMTDFDYIITDVSYINDKMQQANTYLKCQSYVGLSGIKKILWNIFKKNITAETKLFDKKEHALKWLADYS